MYTLLKKQEVQDETAKEYIEVLDRQAERLKKLIEDLLEASKASTGNIAVDLMPLNETEPDGKKLGTGRLAFFALDSYGGRYWLCRIYGILCPASW